MPSWYRPDPLTRDLIHLINARRHDHGDADVAIDTLQAMLEQDREQDLLTVMAALGEDMAEWLFDLLAEAACSVVMEGETDGMIKLLSDPEDGTVLGGAMVGLRASEVITTVALAVHAKLGVQALAETAAVNPSMSESLQRTAEKAAEGMLGISRVTLMS